jgi:ABC-type transport system substrate-binding protein
VRRALGLAIDRARIVDTVLGGFGTHAALEYVNTAAPYSRAR